MRSTCITYVFSISVLFAAVAMAANNRLSAQQQRVQHDRLVSSLTSGDADRVAAAVDEVRQAALRALAGRAAVMTVLLDADRLAEADSMAQDFIRTDPSARTIDRMQWLRVQILIQQRQWPAALAAARAYFNCCEWNDTADAIGLMSLCYRNATPRDPVPADAFEQEQIISANGYGATTQPSPEADLQPSLTAADSETFAAVANAVRGTDCRALAQKANLLLLAGHAKEAGSLFEREAAIAERQAELVEAYIGQARALRAEYGRLGPANAFIESLRNQR